MTNKIQNNSTNISLETHLNIAKRTSSKVTDNILDLIGNTLMLKLNKLATSIQRTILGKL